MILIYLTAAVAFVAIVSLKDDQTKTDKWCVRLTLLSIGFCIGQLLWGAV